MKRTSLLVACLALAAMGAGGATFSLNSLEGKGAAVFGIDTLSHYASAYVLETYPSPRAITNVVQVLPVTQWGSGTITVKLGDEVKDTHDFASDGTWAWQPTEKGTWTIIHSSAVPGGVGTATFNVSSIAFIEGEGSKDEPKTAEDAESVEHLIAEAEENEETIYVEVGGGDGEPVTVTLDDGGDEDPETGVTVEIPDGTTIAVDSEGTITVPYGTTVVVTINGAPTEVAGLVSVKKTGETTGAVSETVRFTLASVGEKAIYFLNTVAANSGAYTLETMADAYGVRTVTNAVQVLPITVWGSGSVTFAHEGGDSATESFTADGTVVWKPTLSGEWTVTHSGDTTPPGGTSVAKFVLATGGAQVAAVTMSGIELGDESALDIEFAPTLKADATMGGADWFSSAKASGLVKVRAATTLEALDTASATILDLDDLGAAYNPETGKVTFSLTAEKMAEIDPSAKAMFFKVEVR